MSLSWIHVSSRLNTKLPCTQFSDQPIRKGSKGRRAAAEPAAAKKRRAEPKPVLMDDDTGDSELTDEDSETSDAESPAAAKTKEGRKLCAG